jgi:WD40 repeat protein
VRFYTLINVAALGVTAGRQPTVARGMRMAARRWVWWLKAAAVAAWLSVHAALVEQLQPLPRHTLPAAATWFAFTPDARALVTTGGPHVRVWDVATGRLRHEWPVAKPREYAPFVSLSPDGRWSLHQNHERDALFLLELDTGRSVELPPVGQLVSGVRANLQFQPSSYTGFSPDGRVIAHLVALPQTGSFVLRLWDIQARAGRDLPLDGPGYSPAFTPDGRTLAVWVEGSQDVPPHVQLFDLDTGRRAARLTTPLGAATRMLFAPDGRTLAVCGLDFLPSCGLTDLKTISWLQLWDVLTGQPLATLRDAWSADWSADGRLLIYGSEGLHPHDARTGERLARWGQIGTRFYGLSAGGRVALYLTADYRPTPWRDWLVSRLSLLAKFFPSYRAAVHFLDTSTGDESASLWVNTDSLVLSPDGRTLATRQSYDRSVGLWDIPPPRPGGVVLALMIGQVGLLTVWTAWRRGRRRRSTVAVPEPR